MLHYEDHGEEQRSDVFAGGGLRRAGTLHFLPFLFYFIFSFFLIDYIYTAGASWQDSH